VDDLDLARKQARIEQGKGLQDRVVFLSREGIEALKAYLVVRGPAATDHWSKKWVVHCKSVGTGQAALKYLATYVFRVAISNNRLVSLENEQVTFRYTDSNTGKKGYSTLSSEEFIRRFLQHVLPKGFMKVRYYGLFSPTHRPRLKRVRQLLEGQETPQAQDDDQTQAVLAALETNAAAPSQSICCPKCGQPMQLVETIQPKRKRPP
jgi:hypothetical protein